MAPKDVRIVFMGTPEFAVPSLRLLASADFIPEVVVTAPDRPRGRGQKISPTPVKQVAQQLGVSRILQPVSVKDPSFIETMQLLAPDIIVVVAFRILPRAVFSVARLGTFNLHASLLPLYRGAAPIHRAVMAGEEVTGVTTFFLQDTVDTGSIILQKSLPVGPEETTGEVYDRLKELGARAVLKTVQHIVAGSVRVEQQDDSQATRAPKIFKEDCGIPGHAPATVVHNHCRGLSPHPGAWTYHNTTRLKVYRTRPCTGSGVPGEVLSTGTTLQVACGTGAVEILELQQQGRRRMEVGVFLQGYTLETGDYLLDEPLTV